MGAIPETYHRNRLNQNKRWTCRQINQALSRARSVAPGQVLPDTYDVARYLSQAMPYATRCTVIDRFEQSFKKTTTVIEHEDVIRVQFLPLRS